MIVDVYSDNVGIFYFAKKGFKESVITLVISNQCDTYTIPAVAEHTCDNIIKVVFNTTTVKNGSYKVKIYVGGTPLLDENIIGETSLYILRKPC